MSDTIDYTNYIIDLKNHLDAINSTNSGLNETLNQIMHTTDMTAYICEVALYMLAAVAIVYLVGVMLKITFSR